MLKPWLILKDAGRAERLILDWPKFDSWCLQHCGKKKKVFLFITFHDTSCISCQYGTLPQNSAQWPCCCHIITNTCLLITYTCCSPNEMVVQWQHRLRCGGLCAHGGGFVSILRCLGHLGNPSPRLTLTLRLKPSIFSFLVSNKCVTLNGWPSVTPICCHERCPQHLIWPVWSVQSAETCFKKAGARMLCLWKVLKR